MRILFALPGLHKIYRGAEIAILSVARSLADDGADVTLIGSGNDIPGTAYRFKEASSVAREKLEWLPSIPTLRNECAYEELSFLPSLCANYSPEDYDVTLTCGYPFINWFLRLRKVKGSRPPHVFITQNGDWPAYSLDSEYRFFGCEGLICTNPDYYERNRDRWHSALIPNGVDVQKFQNSKPAQDNLGFPPSCKVVLMVSALIPSKRVDLGIMAVSTIPDCYLVVAGDGPERTRIDDLANKLMPGRFKRLSVPPDDMPTVYKTANVFLHLSKEESFGNVYLEALAAGLPIVSPDTSRIRWIVGDNEFLFSGDQPDQIAQIITAAINSGLINNTERLKRAQKFDWGTIAKKYGEFLEGVTAANRSIGK